MWFLDPSFEKSWPESTFRLPNIWELIQKYEFLPSNLPSVFPDTDSQHSFSEHGDNIRFPFLQIFQITHLVLDTWPIF